MKKMLFTFMFVATVFSLQAQNWQNVALNSQITHPQPMTGLVLWGDNAEDLKATFGNTITLEFSYCLPSKVVTGCESDGTIKYDWSYFEDILNGAKSRGHQLIARFRYEYPNNDETAVVGATAVPQYIKDQSGYKETYNADAGGDGKTYYADWSNEELQRFTLQFYTDFAKKYANDPRLAFIQVGFGHWSEYHIYGTDLKLGKNFPSKDFQEKFFDHLNDVMQGIPWGVSVDAADEEYTPIVGKSKFKEIPFGLFDDSFMHEGHEVASGDGYNEENWAAIDSTRWKRSYAGGEISYYEEEDQYNFLNPEGMYGYTWEEMAAKYHISFMTANDAPNSAPGFGTPDRFKEASMATGYRFKVISCRTNGESTELVVTNEGIAPIYKDAYFAIGEVRATQSLKYLLPGEQKTITISAPLFDGKDLVIESDAILETQEIEYNAALSASSSTNISNQKTIISECYYDVLGRIVDSKTQGFVIKHTIYSDGTQVQEKKYQ